MRYDYPETIVNAGLPVGSMNPVHTYSLEEGEILSAGLQGNGAPELKKMQLLHES